MKITLHIEKVHLYAFILVSIMVASAVLVVGTGFSAGQASHTTLFTDTLRGKTGSRVTVNDDFAVSGRFLGVQIGTTAGPERLEIATRSAPDTSIFQVLARDTRGTFGVGIYNDIDFHARTIRFSNIGSLGESSPPTMTLGLNRFVGFNGIANPIQPVHIKGDVNNDVIRMETQAGNFCFIRVSDSRTCPAGDLILANSNRAICLICN